MGEVGRKVELDRRRMRVRRRGGKGKEEISIWTPGRRV